jgi:hypothetical protein
MLAERPQDIFDHISCTRKKGVVLKVQGKMATDRVENEGAGEDGN